MSQESQEWLNQNVLIGRAKDRGKAWHYRASAQGAEPNHYDEFIPVEDVERRLFNWEAQVVPAYVGIPVLDSDGEPVTRNGEEIGRDESDEPIYEQVPVFKPEIDGDRRYVIASDTHEKLGNFTDDYVPHQYREWLVGNVKNLMDEELGISSAGLLDGRGVAWVEVSMPDNREVEGLVYRPNLLATTSFNGKIATQYKRTVTATVCDNTLNAALAEAGPSYKLKHTKDSGLKIVEAREALGIIMGLDKAFEDGIKRLADVKITDEEWEHLIEELFPEGKSDNATARARSQRAKIDHLWRYDSRVTPWANSGLGAYQAWNTMQTHYRQAYGSTNVVERQMLDVIKGETENRDKPMLLAIDRLREAQATTTVQVNGLAEVPTVPAPEPEAPEPGPAAKPTGTKTAPKRATRAKSTTSKSA